MRGVVLGHTDSADDTDFLEPWAALGADSTDFWSQEWLSNFGALPIDFILFE